MSVDFSNHCRSARNACAQYCHAVVVPQLDVKLLLVAWRFPVKQPNQECLLTASEETVEVLTWGENLFDHAKDSGCSSDPSPCYWSQEWILMLAAAEPSD